ncbi:MAG: helix-hairpin-helix domain-containing protein [Planctomycetia bacterium]|nr:helix-hairpin-helix domain-containing protein [Planctomycetia bacterium]
MSEGMPQENTNVKVLSVKRDLGRAEQVAVMGVLGIFFVGFLVFLWGNTDFWAVPERKPMEVRHLPAREGVPLRYLVDLNTAGIPELMLLPGIGEVTARKIVAEREKNGPFRSVGDLRRVTGIGDRKIGALEGYVTEEAVAWESSEVPFKNRSPSVPESDL